MPLNRLAMILMLVTWMFAGAAIALGFQAFSSCHNDLQPTNRYQILCQPVIGGGPGDLANDGANESPSCYSIHLSRPLNISIDLSSRSVTLECVIEVVNMRDLGDFHWGRRLISHPSASVQELLPSSKLNFSSYAQLQHHHYSKTPYPRDHPLRIATDRLMPVDYEYEYRCGVRCDIFSPILWSSEAFVLHRPSVVEDVGTPSTAPGNHESTSQTPTHQRDVFTPGMSGMESLGFSHTASTTVEYISDSTAVHTANHSAAASAVHTANGIPSMATMDFIPTVSASPTATGISDSTAVHTTNLPTTLSVSHTTTRMTNMATTDSNRTVSSSSIATGISNSTAGQAANISTTWSDTPPTTENGIMSTVERFTHRQTMYPTSTEVQHSSANSVSMSVSVDILNWTLPHQNSDGIHNSTVPLPRTTALNSTFTSWPVDRTHTEENPVSNIPMGPPRHRTRIAPNSTRRPIRNWTQSTTLEQGSTLGWRQESTAWLTPTAVSEALNEFVGGPFDLNLLKLILIIGTPSFVVAIAFAIAATKYRRNRRASYDLEKPRALVLSPGREDNWSDPAGPSPGNSAAAPGAELDEDQMDGWSADKQKAVLTDTADRETNLYTKLVTRKQTSGISLSFDPPSALSRQSFFKNSSPPPPQPLTPLLLPQDDVMVYEMPAVPSEPAHHYLNAAGLRPEESEPPSALYPIYGTANPGAVDEESATAPVTSIGSACNQSLTSHGTTPGRKSHVDPGSKNTPGKSPAMVNIPTQYVSPRGTVNVAGESAVTPGYASLNYTPLSRLCPNALYSPLNGTLSLTPTAGQSAGQLHHTSERINPYNTPVDGVPATKAKEHAMAKTFVNAIEDQQVAQQFRSDSAPPVPEDTSTPTKKQRRNNIGVAVLPVKFIPWEESAGATADRSARCTTPTAGHSNSDSCADLHHHIPAGSKCAADDVDWTQSTGGAQLLAQIHDIPVLERHEQDNLATGLGIEGAHCEVVALPTRPAERQCESMYEVFQPVRGKSPASHAHTAAKRLGAAGVNTYATVMSRSTNSRRMDSPSSFPPDNLPPSDQLLSPSTQTPGSIIYEETYNG